MLAKPCLFDYWRNFMPIAPELHFDAKNSEVTRYSLSDINLQGARDEDGTSPTDGVLDKVPTQRGWRLTPIIISGTKHGTIEISRTEDEFVYTPRSGYRGIDCFNYVLTNGTQQSQVGTCYVNVIPWYQYQMKASWVRADRTRFVFSATPDPILSTMAKVLFTEYAWYYNQYRAELDSEGVIRIFKRRQILFATQKDMRTYNLGTSTLPTVTNLYNKIITDTYLDTALGSGFNGNLNRPFSPSGTMGEIELEIKVYTVDKPTPPGSGFGRVSRQVDLSQYFLLNLRMSDKYGKRWWQSGNILPSSVTG